MRAIFPDCCAWANGPTTASTKAIIESPTHFRFLISDRRNKNWRHALTKMFSYVFPPIENRQSKIESLDHPIRALQHADGNREIDLLRRFQIDDKLEFRRLLHGKIGGLGALENLVDVMRGALVEVDVVRPVGHETALIGELPRKVNRR